MRNIWYSSQDGSVALRKESVDRNCQNVTCSASRYVALRKESVDRNWCQLMVRSFSSVALRKESVDRNYCAVVAFQNSPGRSPQGERG